MNVSFSIALSGLNAAAERVAVASTNIANARSLGATGQSGDQGFTPVQAQQVSDAHGGTRVVTRPVDPASVPSFEPSNPAADANGLVPRPNVNLENELVDMLVAQRAFESSLKALSTADAMLGTLLDRRS